MEGGKSGDNSPRCHSGRKHCVVCSLEKNVPKEVRVTSCMCSEIPLQSLFKLTWIVRNISEMNPVQDLLSHQKDFLHHGRGVVVMILAKKIARMKTKTLEIKETKTEDKGAEREVVYEE
uniref:Uncharacterized protein n=1 Tax=Cacopsylla melanoneura TaxID=428564 RepID=A0A8D8YNJ1_9HEMI